MHHLTFLQDLSIVIIVAAITTVLFRQLRQPVVLGYILAGLLIGPHTPPFSLIENREAIDTLAELGVIFLMFALGLEFSLRKLKAVGSTALVAATLEIALLMWAGYSIGQFFGWSQMDSIFLGAILSVSSTTIIIKALDELGKTKEKFAQLIFGVLIVEDILAIVLIALLSGLATTGSLEVGDASLTILKLSAFLVALLVIGLILVPRLLNYVARFKSDEMLLITAVGLCFGVSLLTVKLGYSVALGAFMIGAIIAESRQIARVESLMHPVRDLFSAVFFVSIGLLIEPALLAEHAVPIVVITLATIFGKIISCSLGCFLTGKELKTSMKVGMGLAQIGEFSFIIAALGLTLKVTSPFLYPIAVAVSAITTLLTPYLIRSSDFLVQRFEYSAPKALLGTLRAYTLWIGHLQDAGSKNVQAQKVRGLIAQIFVHLLLVTAVFIGAASILEWLVSQWPQFPGGRNGLKAALWLGAMLCSLPLLAVVWRKLKTLSGVVAETDVPVENGGSKTEALRLVVANTVLLVSSGILVFILLALSSVLLPSTKVMMMAAGVFALVAMLLYKTSSKIYARAHDALQETFAQTPLAHDEEPVVIPPLLREAQLRTIGIASDSPAAGKMIIELELRSRTGVSIVGIDRQGESIINPPPDQELAAGDQVLLLGSRDQLQAAEQLLNEPPRLPDAVSMSLG